MASQQSIADGMTSAGLKTPANYYYTDVEKRVARLSGRETFSSVSTPGAVPILFNIGTPYSDTNSGGKTQKGSHTGSHRTLGDAASAARNGLSTTRSRGRDMREKIIRNSASNTPAITPANMSAGQRSAKHGSLSVKNGAFTPNAGATPHSAVTPHGVFMQGQPLHHLIAK